MYLERYFDVTLQITNPILFCANKRNNIIIELKNQYENKCFQGSYISKIINVLQTSKCKIINSNPSAQATIDVKFLALVFIINEWEIIIGAEVINKTSMIICSYKKDNMDICISSKPTSTNNNNFILNQYIPFRILASLHRPKTNKINAVGILLSCDTKADVYKIEGEINKQHISEINKLLDNIVKELKRRSELIKTNKERFLFFEKLLYSYNNYPDKTEEFKLQDSLTYFNYYKKIEGNLVSVFDLIDNNLTGYWYRPLEMFRSFPYLIKINTNSLNNILLKNSIYNTLTKNIPSNTPLNDIINNIVKENILDSVKDTSVNVLVINYLKQILSFLQAISDLVEFYNSDEIVQQHENIWSMIRSKQLPIIDIKAQK